MRLAYLDPPYSLHFHRLARHLADGAGAAEAVRPLLSSPAYLPYCGDDPAQVWPPGELPPGAAPRPEFDCSLGEETRDPHWRAVYAHARAWLRERLAADAIELLLIFSDARPFSAAAREAAAELGIVCLIFERGAFRLRTSSLSSLGLNARFHLQRAAALPGLQGVPGGRPGPLRPLEPGLKLRFGRFMLHNRLACWRDPRRALMQHKRYAPLRYAHLWLTQQLHTHGPGGRDLRALDGLDGRPLVIVALQLESDTQFIRYAPFEGNQAFLDFVGQALRLALPQARVLVKRHPMDIRRYRLPPGQQWVRGPLPRFWPADPIVVCVNSTVGFEAAVEGLRVVCLGPSFYSASPAVTLATPANLVDRLRAQLQRPHGRAVGRALRAEVLRTYQAPGDVWAYTDADLVATAEVVRQHWQAARATAEAGATAPRLPRPAGLPQAA